MAKTHRVHLYVSAALILTAVFTLLGFRSPVSAQVNASAPANPSVSDCFSARHHAASDCDRLASAQLLIPPTGAGLVGPTLLDCYSDRYHAASDCDRLALVLNGRITGESSP